MDNLKTNNDPNFHVNDDSYFYINDDPKIEFDDNADFYINDDPDFYINIEYPETNPDGVAYVYNVEGWEEPLAIQYSIGKPGVEYKVMCPYLGVEVKREMRTCQGSKLCEFAASELHNQTHQCVVDINSDLMMQISHEISSSNMETNTFELYLAACETPCNFRQNKQLCEGKPRKKLDMRNFKRIDIKANYNVSISGQDKEKLEYEKHMLMIAEDKEKLRELQISNAIKEREYGLEE
ncbi:hypothetical protein C2G38_2039787 [Gigaspora rosea]|uniref:Uncharacterized protein n=1 Tax=Gigaspora rosea TaxID=44941 RepID=A0A397UXG2_9GLOM|nr:hypothetical protein C2G38_2039787 [Gigaspora rosea]